MIIHIWWLKSTEPTLQIASISSKMITWSSLWSPVLTRWHKNQVLEKVHPTQKYEKASTDEISYLVPSAHFQHQETNLSHSSPFLQQICSTLRVHSQSGVGKRYLTSSKHNWQISGIIVLAEYILQTSDYWYLRSPYLCYNKWIMILWQLLLSMKWTVIHRSFTELILKQEN